MDFAQANVRLRHGKCHRKYTAWLFSGVPEWRPGKGEKVRPLRRLNVRAHRLDSDIGGRVNPTRSKTK